MDNQVALEIVREAIAQGCYVATPLAVQGGRNCA